MDETPHRPVRPDGPEKDPETCNLCGLTCRLGDTKALGGALRLSVTGGYESTPGNGYGALDDMTEYRFQLCEFCLDWLFSQMQVLPEVHCHIQGAPETYAPADIRARQVAKHHADSGGDLAASLRHLNFFLWEKHRRDEARARSVEHLYYRPDEGAVCEAHDWPTEGLAKRLVTAMRDRHEKGGLTVCVDCLRRGRDSVDAAGKDPPS